jgi:voltage-dependent calcium channel
MERKKSGRMTDVPQLGPEVYVDDEHDTSKQTARATVSPLLSPEAADTRSSFITHGLEGAMRSRRGTDASMTGYPLSPRSPGLSPQLSPHRPTNSAYSFEGGELGGGDGSNHSSRRGSAAENVLEVLDNSAWGESIRRSFTMRRPSRRGSSR